MKVLKKVLKVVVVIIVVLLIILATLNVVKRIMYSEFYATAETEYDMPGLGDGLIQQGLSYYEGGFI